MEIHVLQDWRTYTHLQYLTMWSFPLSIVKLVVLAEVTYLIK